MARNSPSTFNADSVNFITAVEMSFDSGAVRVWNGYHPITIEGEEYLGLADLLDQLLGKGRVQQTMEQRHP